MNENTAGLLMYILVVIFSIVYILLVGNWMNIFSTPIGDITWLDLIIYSVCSSLLTIGLVILIIIISALVGAALD
jgi:hypothetical protein